MRCYFLRHGLAGDPAEWQGNDFDRPLTDEGETRMAREAKTIDKLNLGLDAIVTSPLVRAKQTATIVAERLDLTDKLEEDPRVGGSFDIKGLSGILEQHPDADAIMLVGHEPSMSDVIGTIIGGGTIDLKKGGLACVELRDPSSLKGQLVWLIPPKLLVL
jgi:phosphohistidine phosphatase